MEENKELDEKIAKERLKTKRIKKKVYLKKLMGIPDKNAAVGDEYGDESDDHENESHQQEDEPSEVSEQSDQEEEYIAEPPSKRKKIGESKETKALRLLSQSLF